MAKISEYRSNVFSMLLEDKKNCLEIYNALNGTSYENPEEVIVNRLENGIILTIRNDASFLIDSNINIYEHQSRYNPNMPLRSLIYFVELIKEIIADSNLYGRKLIEIPTPHFVVFYNGIEKRPEKEELKLSSAYTHQVSAPELELKCTVYNINVGNNGEFLSKCSVINEYMIFVDKVRDCLDMDLSIEEALDISIKECIEEDVLKEFLIERGNEVRDVAALDYTFERREILARREEREEGYAEGKKDGVTEGIGIGLERGVEQGIKIFIQDKIDDGIEKDIIIDKIIKRFSKTKDEAESLYESALLK